MFRITLILVLVACSTAFGQYVRQFEQYELIASDGAENDRFGIKVSISGDYALIGAYQDDDNGSNSGSAYIFHFDGSTWSEQAKLLASDGDINDNFGLTVCISGDTAIVGAPNKDVSGENSGAAYIFRRVGVQWNEEAKLIPADGAATDSFGVRVSISGNHAIVGSYKDDNNSINSGSAYIYRFNGTNWLLETKLRASDGDMNDRFGRAVAITDTIAAVGARLDDDLGEDSGSLYIFRYDGNQWNEEIKLQASDGGPLDNFGHSVSISNDAVIVGARQGGQTSSGAAYIFRFVNGEWIEDAILGAFQGSYLDEFGHSVSIDGNVAVVGAGGDDDNGNNSGCAYIFRYIFGQWFRTKILASDGAANDNFGLAVAFENNTALVGSRFHDDNGNNAGSAYVYTVGILWTVDDDSDAHFNNIQTAIDTASNGDEIVVMPGTYFGTGDEVVNLLGKELHLYSNGGSEQTFINGNGERRGILCWDNETDKTIIEGFTITNCNSGVDGGAVVCLNSTPKFVGCTITNQNGVGLYTSFGNPVFKNCIFRNNTDRGAACIGNVTFHDCLFDSNSTSGPHSGAAMDLQWCDGTIANCTFVNNIGSFYGGALAGEACSATFTNCTITDNVAANLGGGILFESHKPPDTYPTFLDSMICNNLPNQISGGWIDGGGNYVKEVCPTYCNDLTGDFVVNINDLLIVIAEWGEIDSPADITLDGIVDVSDLLLLVECWGPCV